MDTAAARLVNFLVGNAANEGVLECHFPPGEFVFKQAALVAFGGGDFNLKANGLPLQNWRPHLIPADTKITSSGLASGARLYMGVGGGFAVDRWLGSQSTHLTAQAGGFHGRALSVGDELPFRRTEQAVSSKIRRFSWGISPQIVSEIYERNSVRLVSGPEWDWLDATAQPDLAKRPFVVSALSNRMGYRLEGPPLERRNTEELVSSAVTKGTVQLLPSGQLIILMADHQTTGGYPRIAQVAAADHAWLAQQSAGTQLRFSFVSPDEAERFLLQQENTLEIIRLAAKAKWADEHNL
jgi:antagonist of KipI